MSLCPSPHPTPFFSLCSDGPLCASPSLKPPLKATAGQGLNVTLGHQSAQPARVSWGRRVRDRGKLGGDGGGRGGTIVH